MKFAATFCFATVFTLFVIGCDSQQKIPDAGMGYGKPISQDVMPENENTSTETGTQTSIEQSKPAQTNDVTKLPPLMRTTARALMPAQNIKGTYTADEGKNKGKSFQFTYEMTPNGLILNIEGLRRVYFEWDSQGNLILKRDDDFQENVRVMYNPGLVILPAKLEEREPKIKGVSKVEVFGLTNGNRRAVGTVSNEITAIWQSQIPLNNQEIKAYIIREKRMLDLDIAKVQLTLDTAFAPGKGELLQMEWRTQKALDIFVENSKSKLSRTK
ncbi:hypothetical protein JD969_20230 [Planctomycetota bacterium]|nr:hypothetical protein JD969_20230 [Planctomycetota bacterium]